MTREELIVATEITFEKLMTPTRGLPIELLEEPMAEGKWSFRDLVAHLIFWDGLLVRALEEMNYGRNFDWSPYVGHFDEWNAKATAKLRTHSLKRMLSELRLTHSTMTEVLRRVPEENLLKEGKVPHFMTWILIGHVEHHTPQVVAWAERMRKEGRAPAPLPILGN